MPRRTQRPLRQRALPELPHCASVEHVRGWQQPDAPHTSSAPQLVAVQAATQEQPHWTMPGSSHAGTLPQTG